MYLEIGSFAGDMNVLVYWWTLFFRACKGGFCVFFECHQK